MRWIPLSKELGCLLDFVFGKGVKDSGFELPRILNGCYYGEWW